MDKPLIEKVRDALAETCKLDPRPDIRLELVEPDRITGLVLSTLFAGLTPSERQERIWESFDARLTPSERNRIIFIVLDTPEANVALQTPARGA